MYTTTSVTVSICNHGNVEKSYKTRACASATSSFLRSKTAVALSKVKLHSSKTNSGRVFAAFEDQDPAAEEAARQAQLQEMEKKYEEAMKDPQTAAQVKQMEQAMASPAYQQQMQAMQQHFQSDATKAAMEELKNDPEMKEFFEAIEKEGPQGMMKFWSDPKILEKFAAKVGPPPTAQAPPPPEINTLIDACKYGDVEAAEDFIAIGKDVNEADDVGRTPLHFAAAVDKTEIVSELLSNGAGVNNTDEKNNTPLHYAAGYGRMDSLQLLLDAGADVAIKNGTDKTAGDLVKMEPRNPINNVEELMEKLGV